MKTTQGEHAQTELAHELFAAAQLAPGEGIEDAVSRIAAALTAAPSVSDGQRALHEAILNRLSHAELLEKAHYLMELNSNQARTIGELQGLVEDATAQPAAPQGVVYAELPEPDSYLFQHDETGLTQFVDAQQVEWGFQQNNPRLRRIGGAYTADKMRDFADRTHALRASHGQAPASRITVEQVEDAVGLQSTAWDTIGAEKIVEAVLRLANGQAPAGATNTKTHALLSTMIGLFLRAKEKIGYQPGSAIDKTVAEAVEHLKDWPYPETPTAQAAPAAGAVAGPTRAQIRDVFLANGFTVKEGQTDLKQYVYDAAEALLALAAAPTQAQAGAVPLTDEQCDAIYEALDAFGREVDHYEYGLPYCTSDGETLAKPEAREVIRQAAHGIKGADHD